MRPVVTLAALSGAGCSAVGPRIAERLGGQFSIGRSRVSVAKRQPALCHLVIDGISLGVERLCRSDVKARESLTRDPVPTRAV